MLHNDPRKISGLSQKHAFSEGWHEIMALASVQPRFESKQKYVVKIKALLRKLKIILLPQLPHSIAETFSRIHPSDCAGWFSAAGIPC